MSSLGLPESWLSWRSAVGGMLLCSFIAIIAGAINSVSGVPTMVLALVLGVGVRAAFNQKVEIVNQGVSFCAHSILRIGIALLGFRIIAADVMSLGWSTAVIVLATLAATLFGGYMIGKAFGQRSDVSVISATSIAVCGASAALAASAVLPPREGLDRETLTIVVIVSLLSTIVMIVYPMLTKQLGFDAHSTALVLGAAIHDVAQVAGAGFAISPEVGLDAVTVKMVRIGCLLPVIFAIGTLRNVHGYSSAKLPINRLFPTFLLSFLLFASVANLGLVPAAIVKLGGETASWALTTSVAALGLKTSLDDACCMNHRLILTLTAQTLWQLGSVLFLILAFR